VPPLRPTTPTMADVSSLQIIDRENDSLLFRIAGSSALALEVDGQLHCPQVTSIEYEVIDGMVVTQGAAASERGQFWFQPAKQLQEVEALRSLARQADVPFLELDSPLPEAIESLLVDDTLKESRPGVRILYNRVLNIYPTTEDALAAVSRNSALVLPYLNKPYHVDGSWRILTEMMGEEEALAVVNKNPGLLTCNPAGLKGASVGDIKRAAMLVEIVEAVPVSARWGLVAVVTAGFTVLIGNGLLDSWQLAN